MIDERQTTTRCILFIVICIPVELIDYASIHFVDYGST